MPNLMMDPNDSLLLLIDVQEKLWPHIENKDQVLHHCRVLLQGAPKLGIPVLVTEQYPKGLGPTLELLKEVQPEQATVCEKTSFGCLGDPDLFERIVRTGRSQLVLCGIETHVCVLQTALEALAKDFRVAVIADAVGSRVDSNRQLALDRLRAAGATIVSTEMILFEWMKTAKHSAFKEISALVK